MAQRHHLPLTIVIGPNGAMTETAGAEFAGLDRMEARKAVVAKMESLGLLLKTEKHVHRVGHSQRSNAPIEPYLSEQWFLRYPSVGPSTAAVENGQIQFHPERWSKTYLHWMANIRDWCISRQLWWGHRIPVWYCEACGEGSDGEFIVVSRTDPAHCPNCYGTLRQDPDVLDTWFSSGLWPFSTLGWPERTADLENFYPTMLLITGFDILFFWVARMAMLGIEFMGDVPFRQVYIHGLVRDAEKQKMSKTKGNVIDPLVVTEQYGTDAVRMALLTGAAPGTDIVFSTDRLESARAFANKIWNASRFLFTNMDRCGVPPWVPEDVNAWLPGPDAPIEDKWIFSRLNECAREVNRAIEQFRFHEAAQSVWRFFWNEFCDWYVELKKLRFVENSGLNDDWRNLLAVFEGALRLLHPAIPFVTEELWDHFGYGAPCSLIRAAWPEVVPVPEAAAAREELDWVVRLVGAVRSVRTAMNVPPGAQVPILLRDAAPETLARAERWIEPIRRLARGSEVRALVGEMPKGAAQAVVDEATVVLPLAGTIDLDAERVRLTRERDKAAAEAVKLARKLENADFVARAPEDVVAENRERLAGFHAEVARLEAALRWIG